MTAPLRIAVVGGGPKALFALESLALRLQRRGAHSPSDIVIFEPQGVLGFGAAYADHQPHYLLLNVTAAIVDAHEPEASPRIVDSFYPWAREHQPEYASADFPPRAVVGEYLAHAWSVVIAALEDSGATVDHVRERVSDPAHVLGGPGQFDEVLIATGHAPDHPGALHHTWSSDIPLVPRTLPVGDYLSEERIPAGSRVATRGGALTFIDAAIALTEGRGGRFSSSSDGGLTYEPSGSEPEVILPITREGLFLDAKPQPGTPLPDGADAVLASAAASIRDAGAPAQVIDAVRAAAVGLLVLARRTAPGGPLIEPQADAAVGHTLEHGTEPGTGTDNRAEESLRASADVSAGERAPGAAWALGRAWSELYPEIVERLSYEDIPEDEWEEWSDVAGTCERFAFGPPLINARKLLALIDAGMVDTSWMDAGVSVDDDGVAGLPDGHLQPDVVIDAVIPSAGIRGTGEPLTTALADAGWIDIPDGRRGARTARDGRTLAAGAPPLSNDSPVLSLIGRPTEDWVIGHDTLNRVTHNQPALWAERVAARLNERTNA